MQTVSEDFLLAMTGSLRPTLVCDAWYDGDLVYPNLPVTSASITFDGSRDVVGDLKISCASEDDVISPVNLNSPLAPFGSEIHVRVGYDHPSGLIELVSLGWYRIDESTPDTIWQQRRAGIGMIWVPTGTTVNCAASDRMSYLIDARLVGASQPKSFLSTITEIKRLARDLVPISGEWDAVTDKVIPKTLVYDQELVPTIQRLAEALGYKAVFDSDGTLAPRTLDSGSTPIWTIDADPTAISYDRKISRAGIYNAVLATGESTDQAPVQGVAIESGGFLRYGGPFGRVPYKYSSPLLTTQSAAQQAAVTVLKRLAEDRVTDVAVTALANPALEVGDVVAINMPDRVLTGPITKISFNLNPLSTMQLTLSVPRDQLVGL